MEENVPGGPYCYDLHLFSKSITCASLDAKVAMSPKCNKFNVALSWNVSGRILKCKECNDRVNRCTKEVSPL